MPSSSFHYSTAGVNKFSYQQSSGGGGDSGKHQPKVIIFQLID